MGIRCQGDGHLEWEEIPAASRFRNFGYWLLDGGKGKTP